MTSEWELEEIRQELRSGVAPDIVAFRHSLPPEKVRCYARYHKRIKTPHQRWTDVERAFVRDNYPNHGKGWVGWKMLKRSWDAIKQYASIHGIGKRRDVNQQGNYFRESNEGRRA